MAIVTSASNTASSHAEKRDRGATGVAALIGAALDLAAGRGMGLLCSALKTFPVTVGKYVLLPGELKPDFRARQRSKQKDAIPCNLGAPSAVYITDLGALGRGAARRLDRAGTKVGNWAAERKRRLQTGLQQACNLPATSLHPLRDYGMATVLLPYGYGMATVRPGRCSGATPAFLGPLGPQPPNQPRLNRVLELDGTGRYVELSPNIFNDLDEATIEVWVRWDDFGGSLKRVFNYDDALRDMSIVS
jgi:hypothetical protein